MIAQLEPCSVFRFFDEICRIPRPSKKEGNIIAYLQNFGQSRGLETITDVAGNVLIRKPATVGKEQSKTIVLQAHMDMVCEKNANVEHDFLKDAIKTYIDGDWIRARGTTLGADNGIGIAAILAVLDANNLEHGNIEALFTVDEETGLTGAFALSSDLLKGEILINLDSEDDGELFIGCAGGCDTLATFDYEEESGDEKMFFFTVNVSGLLGGHSGDDIDKGRANANKLLVEYLARIAEKTTLRISYIDGGNLRNAIAREAWVIAAVPFSYKETLRVEFNHFLAEVEERFCDVEPNLSMTLQSESPQKKVIDIETSKALLTALLNCPHGVMAMSESMPDLVETSTNLASIKMLSGKITISTSQRSSLESAKNALAKEVENIFVENGAIVTHSDGYPGWNPNTNSKIVHLTAETYERLFGEKARIRAIHAGLECGLFAEKYPHLDMISFGPTMRGVHSPDERLSITATQRFWQLLIEVLKQI
jgi:dipeptidase D